jgi:hypothetical protein
VRAEGAEALSWKVRTGSAQRAFAGAPTNGDAVFVHSERGHGLFAVVDALGHGSDAERSARRAIEVLQQFRRAPPAEIFSQVHAALEGLRGVVMSAIHVEGDDITFLGVGNVELVGPADWPRPPCMPGIVGAGRLHLRPARIAVVPGSRWGLVSDGIRQRQVRGAWETAAELAPERAAQHVLEWAGRVDDDASVLVLDFFGGD